ncbi:MAG: glycosyltransferase, partial [Thermodesulfovibrionales bacterium]|nr:glycosyltransferase [Thermodesulfovibrionales bacterium]
KVKTKGNVQEYAIYETAEDWAIWLAETYNARKRDTDGHSLHYEADGSCDLVHAHGVFVYLSFLHCFEYFNEMLRICKPGGYIVFDFFDSKTFTTDMIQTWLLKHELYPVVLPSETVKTFFDKAGAKLVTEFQNKYGQGFSTYHIYRLQSDTDSGSITKSTATISVVIPTYNREKFLPRAIDSVLRQSHPVSEILVIDDGSTDNTLQLIKMAQQHFPLIKYIRLDKNSGAQNARHVGIHRATGEWLGFLDSDDEWLPDRVNLALEAAERENISVTHCEYIRQHLDGRQFLQHVPPLRGDVYLDFLKSTNSSFPGLLLKKECLFAIGGLDTSLIAWQEWDVLLRLSKAYKFAYIPQPLFIWHWHDEPTISKDEYRSNKGYQQIFEKHEKEILEEAGLDVVMNHLKKIFAIYQNLGAFAEANETANKINAYLKK